MYSSHTVRRQQLKQHAQDIHKDTIQIGTTICFPTKKYFCIYIMIQCEHRNALKIGIPTIYKMIFFMFLSHINNGMKLCLPYNSDHPSYTILGMFLLTKKDYDLGHINEIVYTGNISKDDQIKIILFVSVIY